MQTPGGVEAFAAADSAAAASPACTVGRSIVAESIAIQLFGGTSAGMSFIGMCEGTSSVGMSEGIG